MQEHIDNYDRFVEQNMMPVLQKQDRLFRKLTEGTITSEEMKDLDRISPICHNFVKADKSIRIIIEMAQKGQEKSK